MKKFTYIVSQTYQIVTPESAEQGDFAETGFEFQDEHYDLDDLIHHFEQAGYIHPSSEPLSGKRTWVTSEAIQDRNYYEKGEEKCVSLHLKDILDKDGQPLPEDKQDKIWNNFISKQLRLGAEHGVEMSGY